MSAIKVIDGITALRDESDRQGIRIVIRLRADVQSDIILNKLYDTLNFETFGVILLALVDGHPRVLNLKEVLGYYLDHRLRCNRTSHSIRATKLKRVHTSWKAC